MMSEAELDRAQARATVAPRLLELALPRGLRLGALHWRCPRPAGSPIVLVHGLADTAWVWHAVASVLADRADVFAIELRGHGRSDRGPRGEYARATMAADLREAIKCLALRHPRLVGHSLGAAVVVHAAAADPARFAGVVLVDYATDVPAASLALVRGVIARMQETYRRVEDYEQILQRRHPLAASSLLERMAHGALEACASGFRQRFDVEVLRALEMQDGASMEGLLGRLALPVQLVRGALSWMVTPAAAKRVVDACPAAQAAVVAMSGHSPQVDNPAGTLHALAAFLARTDRR